MVGLPVAATTAVMLVLLGFGARSYADLRQGAQPIPNLGRFLERYVGDCESADPSFNKEACEASAAGFRKQYDGAVILLDVDDPASQLAFSEFDKQKASFRIHLAPFFGERALAISVGKPERLNKDGLPVVKNIPIWIKLPRNEPEFSFRRQLEHGMVRLELLLRPKQPWRFKRRGDADIRGVDTELVGLRVYPARGDQVLAEQTY